MRCVPDLPSLDDHIATRPPFIRRLVLFNADATCFSNRSVVSPSHCRARQTIHDLPRPLLSTRATSFYGLAAREYVPRVMVLAQFGVLAIFSNLPKGRVTSLYGSELQRYTSFRSQPQADGPVRQFLFNDKGVICLGSRSIHMALRRGPTVWNLRSDSVCL